MRSVVFALALTSLAMRTLRASCDDGYGMWLAYRPLPANTLPLGITLTTVAVSTAPATTRQDIRLLNTTVAEVVRALGAMLGARPGSSRGSRRPQGGCEAWTQGGCEAWRAATRGDRGCDLKARGAVSLRVVFFF